MKGILRKLIYFITGYIADRSIKRTAIGDGFTLARKLPVNILKEDLKYFNNELDKSFDPVVKVEIHNGYLLTTEGLIVKHLHIVEESLMDEHMRDWYGISTLWNTSSNSVALPANQKYILLYNHYSAGYGHWLVDVLPRLLVIKNEIHNYKIILPENYNTFHLSTLAPFGIYENNIEYLRSDATYLIPDVTIISHVGATCNTKDEVLQELRRIYLNYYLGELWPKPNKKIYISRSRQTNRKVTNEVEIEALMRAAGYEILYPEEYGFAQQIALFTACKVLIGLTGSGLTNMLFMQNGSSVVEFKMKSDYDNLHYFSMSSGMQLNYYYLLCDVQGSDRFKADFHVDAIALKKIIEDL